MQYNNFEKKVRQDNTNKVPGSLYKNVIGYHLWVLERMYSTQRDPNITSQLNAQLTNLINSLQ